MSLSITHIDMLHVQDDWNWLLRDEASGLVAVVDPSEAKGVEAVLEHKGWGLDYIFCTHHHWDHTNGNLGLKQKYGAKVVGAARDAARIKGIDIVLEENESFQFGAHRFETFDISGHTIGHIAFYCASARLSSLRKQGSSGNHQLDSRFRGNDDALIAPILFCGDTLFAMGCGRMFEGTAEMFHASLQKIAALPDETLIYAAHEYTIANGRFARKMEPDNEAIGEHIALAKARRKAGLPSLPTTLAREKASNPFLRTHKAALRASLEMSENASDIEVFAALREAKDRF